jgi:hypothetical protein
MCEFCVHYKHGTHHFNLKFSSTYFPPWLACYIKFPHVDSRVSWLRLTWNTWRDCQPQTIYWNQPQRNNTTCVCCCLESGKSHLNCVSYSVLCLQSPILLYSKQNFNWQPLLIKNLAAVKEETDQNIYSMFTFLNFL